MLHRVDSLEVRRPSIEVSATYQHLHLRILLHRRRQIQAHARAGVGEQRGRTTRPLMMPIPLEPRHVMQHVFVAVVVAELQLL